MRRNLNIKQRKWRSLIFATVFSVAAATAAIAVEPVESYAYTETAGVLNDGPVQMRKSPVNGEKITSLAAGTAVRVIDEEDGSDGMKWYKVQISYNGMSSTVISGLISSRCHPRILLREVRSQIIQHRVQPELSPTRTAMSM